LSKYLRTWIGMRLRECALIQLPLGLSCVMSPTCTSQIPRTEATAFDNQASGDDICDISILDKSLDGWAQEHGTAWEGERDEGQKDDAEPWRRLVLVSFIEHPVSHSPAQVLFVYRQRGKHYDIELMLNKPKSDMRMMAHSRIYELWTKIYGACHRAVPPPAEDTDDDDD
jgi:hypothetical protein